MKIGEIENTGEAMMRLAEYLSDEHCEITADEILDELTGRLICEEDAGEVRVYLST